MVIPKIYVHKAPLKFKHAVIHVDHAEDLIAEMKAKAAKLGLPASMSLAMLTRAAVGFWLEKA